MKIDMNLNRLRLYFNLFWAPGLLLLAALLGDHHVGTLSGLPMLAGLGVLFGYAIAAAYGGALALILWGSYKLVRAELGLGEFCYNCGAPVRHIGAGRYGPYYKCLACGSNRSLR